LRPRRARARRGHTGQGEGGFIRRGNGGPPPRGMGSWRRPGPSLLGVSFHDAPPGKMGARHPTKETRGVGGGTFFPGSRAPAPLDLFHTSWGGEQVFVDRGTIRVLSPIETGPLFPPHFPGQFVPRGGHRDTGPLWAPFPALAGAPLPKTLGGGQKTAVGPGREEGRVGDPCRPRATPRRPRKSAIPRLAEGCLPAGSGGGQFRRDSFLVP